MGKKIIGIESYWSYWIAINDINRKYYPQDVRIEFENRQKIWISAIEIVKGGNEIVRMKDHLTLIFDKKISEKYHVGINIFD